MTTPNGSSENPKKLTTETVGGIPFEANGIEDTTIKPLPAWMKKHPPLPPLTEKPTSADLAGIPFEPEGIEDNTIRPRRKKKA